MIADARSPGHFTGEQPSTNPALKSGAMPNAINIHYASLLTDQGLMVPSNEIEKRLAEAKIDRSKKVITTCGGGVTAGIIALALELVGHTDYTLYDGRGPNGASRATVRTCSCGHNSAVSPAQHAQYLPNT